MRSLTFLLIAILNIAILLSDSFKIKVLIYEGSFHGVRSKNFKIEPKGNRDFVIQYNKKKYISEKGRRFIKAAMSLPIRGNSYTGYFLFIRINNSIKMINILESDEYIMGVVRKEISYSWPDEAIKAQAVVARTYAYKKYRENKEKEFHTVATDRDQVFGGTWNVHKKIIKNVMAVKDLVITHKGKPIKAYFHASCGGYTEEPEYVWNIEKDAQYFKPVRCYYCENFKKYAWDEVITLKQVNRSFSDYVKKIGEIKNIKTGKTSPSKRNYEIILIGRKKENISGNKFRLRLGAKTLPSLLFTVRKEGKALHFTGKGYGHGVGLCQWGTHQMASDGRSYTYIINYYFKNVKISKIN
ncbi:SpoIID/LytB domain-containing protein [Spirochaetota bacterium]